MKEKKLWKSVVSFLLVLCMLVSPLGTATGMGSVYAADGESTGDYTRGACGVEIVNGNLVFYVDKPTAAQEEQAAINVYYKIVGTEADANNITSIAELPGYPMTKADGKFEYSSNTADLSNEEAYVVYIFQHDESVVYREQIRNIQKIDSSEYDTEGCIIRDGKLYISVPDTSNGFQEFLVYYNVFDTQEEAKTGNLSDHIIAKTGDTVECEVGDMASIGTGKWIAINLNFDPWTQRKVVPIDQVEVISSTGYTVEYYLETEDKGVYPEKASKSEFISAEAGTTVEAVAGTFEGFTFDEDAEENVKNGTVPAEGSLVLKLYYTRNRYNITYELNNGTFAEEGDKQEYVYGVSDLKIPTRENYIFGGWYEDANCEGEKVTELKTQEPGDITLYAKWSEENGNGNPEGKFDLGMAYRDGKLYFWSDKSDELGVNENFMKVCGFYTSIQAAEEEAAKRNADPKMDELPTFILNYDESTDIWYNVTDYKLGNDIKAVMYCDYVKGSYTTFEVVSLEDIIASEPVETTIEHYKKDLNGNYQLAETEIGEAKVGDKLIGSFYAENKFVGYKYNADVENAINAIVVGAKERALLKLYYDIATYKINYDLNAEDDESAELSDAVTKSYTYGVGVPELATPTRNGYWFTGWNTNADGKGDTVESISDSDAGDITLYAQWVAKKEGQAAYTVKHYLQNKDQKGYTLKETEFVANVESGPIVAKANEYTGFKQPEEVSGEADTEGKLVLKLYYDRETYTISYFSGETKLTSEDLPEGSATSYVFGNGVKLPKLANEEDMVFGGWYRNAEFEGTAVGEISDIETGDIRLYARWVTPVTNVTLSETAKTLEVDGSFELTAKIEPEDATDKTVKWTSSDETVATVDNGVVKALKKGTTTITATAVGDVKATCEITVVAKAGTIERTGRGIEKTSNGKILFYVVDVPEGYTFDKGIQVLANGYDTKQAADAVASTNAPTDFWGSPTVMEYDEAAECYFLEVDPAVVTIFQKPYIVYVFHYTNTDGNQLGEFCVVSQGDLSVEGTYTVIKHLQNAEDPGKYDAQTGVTATGRYDTLVKADTTAPKGFVYNPDVEGTLAEAVLTRDEALTLNLYYDRETYGITYELNGGELEAGVKNPGTYVYGVGTDKLNQPKKEGYTFAGWYDNKACTGTAVEAVGTDVTGDLTLYAKWIISVTGIKLNGIEETTSDNPFILEEGNTTTLNVTVEPADATDKTVTYKSSDENVVKVSADGVVKAVGDGTATITITAADVSAGPHTIEYYIKVPAVYFDVTFDPANGEETFTQSVKKNSTATMPETDPTKDGFTFLGWYLEDAKYSFATKVTEEITLTAKWEAITYTVTFDTAGGSKVESQTVAEGDTADEPETPTQAGYKFLGWFVEDEEYDFTEAVIANITLTAKWKKTYTVTFETGEGSEVDSQIVEEGDVPVEPETDPTRPGYKFLGWFIEDEECDFTEVVTADITITAKWEEVQEEVEKKTYTVSFNTDGGSEVESQTVEEGKTAQQPAAPTKAGYKFLGWYVEDEKYNFTEAVTADITITAKWEKIKATYEVFFCTEDGNVVDTRTVEEGSTLTKPEDPTKEGYKFLGWYLDATVYDFTEEVTTDMILIAKWEEIKNEVVIKTYRVTFNSNGGSTVAAQTVEEGKTAQQPAAPTKAGSTFLGWYIGSVAYNFATSVTTDITLTALWRVNPAPAPAPANPEVKVSSIKITGISKQIAIGKKIQLTAEVAPANATNAAVQWVSSNEKFATVDANGLVTISKNGKNKFVTITAIAKDGSGVQETYKIKIMPKAVTKITVKVPAKTVKVGKKLKLKATVSPSKQVNKNLKWTSSNTRYATVTSKGVVKALKAGKGKTVKITVMTTDGSNKKKTIKIKIK